MVPGLWLEPEVVGVSSPVAEQLPGRGVLPARRASASSSTAGTTWTCATRPRSSTWTRSWTSWSATWASATSSSTTTSTSVPAPTPAAGSAGAGLLGAQPGPPRLARRRARPAPRPGDRELRLRRHAHRLRHAVPAAAAVHQRPAGLPALRRRSRPPRPPPSPPSRPPSGPTRSPSSPTTRSRSPWAARCSGRIHLSGHLDRMSPRAARPGRRGGGGVQGSCAPTWPGPCRSGRSACRAGTTPWIALGLRAPRASYLLAWRRGRSRATDRRLIALPVPHLARRHGHARGAVPGPGRGAGRVGADSRPG